MRKIVGLVTLLILLPSSYGDELTQSAVKYYMSIASQPSQYDHILITQLDFRSNGHPDIVICYSYSDYQKHAGNIWTVLEKKKGGWVRLNTINDQGKRDSVPEIVFYHDGAGFVYLKHYKHPGILLRYGFWVFIYLTDNTLKTVFFDAAKIGKSDEQLEQLVNTHKISVQEIAVPDSMK